jgi:hypothetical protein
MLGVESSRARLIISAVRSALNSVIMKISLEATW